MKILHVKKCLRGNVFFELALSRGAFEHCPRPTNLLAFCYVAYFISQSSVILEKFFELRFFHRSEGTRQLCTIPILLRFEQDTTLKASILMEISHHRRPPAEDGG